VSQIPRRLFVADAPVEQADAVAAQVAGHALGGADTGQRAHDDDAGVAVGQQGHGGTLRSVPDGGGETIGNALGYIHFGFGFAELGEGT